MNRRLTADRFGSNVSGRDLVNVSRRTGRTTISGS